ncbi:MAG: hypothetical protein R2822_07270 [Spirosomataceae bacterium]
MLPDTADSTLKVASVELQMGLQGLLGKNNFSKNSDQSRGDYPERQ